MKVCCYFCKPTGDDSTVKVYLRKPDGKVMALCTTHFKGFERSPSPTHTEWLKAERIDRQTFLTSPLVDEVHGL